VSSLILGRKVMGERAGPRHDSSSSPRAVGRLRGYIPWRCQKIFRSHQGGKLIDGAFFEGATINTPSLLCAEDILACV